MLNYFFAYPIATIPQVAAHTNKSYNTIHRIITQFLEQGILLPSDQKRDKVYTFQHYLSL